MSDRYSSLMARSPLQVSPIAPLASPGVVALERDGLGLAVVLVRRNKQEQLAQSIRDGFGVELPCGPRRIAAGDFAIAGTSPGGWLATHTRGSAALTGFLDGLVGGLASVSDQSDGYCVLRLVGSKVRDTLCKLVPVDIHQNAFPVGAVAATAAAHISVTIWRVEDHTDGTPAFEIVVPRSLAGDLWEVLSESAAEYGLGWAQMDSLALRPADSTEAYSRPSSVSSEARASERV